MKKILAFCFFPAFTPPVNGGQSRLFNFYSALSAHHIVTLLTSTHVGGQEERVTHGATFLERRIPKDRHFVDRWMELEKFSSGGDLSGPATAAAAKYPTLLHKTYLEEYEHADIIIHDFPFTVGYDLFRGLDRKLRVYNSHNCESVLYRQLHREARSAPIHALVEAAEVDLLNHADLVHYCNEDDLVAFRKLDGARVASVQYVPHGTSPRPGGPEDRDSEPMVRRDVTTAVFMGSAHPPNIAAARFIAEELAPKLPHVEFQIIGSCLPEGDYGRNVRRLGVVSDDIKEELLRLADVALNPMDSGSGSNVKVVDYFSFGVPLVSTQFGMRGINASPDLHFVAATLDSFENALWEALDHPEVLRKIGAAGRLLAQTTYSWTSIAGVAERRLTALCDEKLERPGNPRAVILNDYESLEAIGGGATRTKGLCEAIAKHQPVVFISFTESDQIKRYRPIDNVTAIAIPKSSAHREEQNRTNALSHISVSDIIASRHCERNALLLKLYEVLRRESAAVVVEHCYMSRLPIRFGDRFIYSSQNAEALLKGAILQGHPMSVELLDELKHLEALTVQHAAAIVAVCDADARAFQAMSNSVGPIIVVPNGAAPPPLDTHTKDIASQITPTISARSAIFIGSAHPPNIECVKFIRDHLARQCRDVEFHIVGSVCRSLGGTVVPSNVHLWGEVDDRTKSAVVGACAIAINPMSSGGGSNVKLADYLAHGKFVVTTEFGQRGYPPGVSDHIKIAPLSAFASAINAALANTAALDSSLEAQRQLFFARHLSMTTLGSKLAELAQCLQNSTRRVLFVTYRYTDPALGGAEVMLAELIKALASDGGLQVDVVAPEVSQISSFHRFAEHYSYEASGALFNVPNLRYMRFPLDSPDANSDLPSKLAETWRAQLRFEHELSNRVFAQGVDSGLTWGWAESNHEGRIALASCGIHIASPGKVQLSGASDVPMSMRVLTYRGELIASAVSEGGDFKLEFDVYNSGDIHIQTSRVVSNPADDPRPLGFLARSLRVGAEAIDLRGPTLTDFALRGYQSDKIFRVLAEAAETSRFELNARLTDTRGPFSSAMEAYIETNVKHYDLVVTHNNIFRPAVFAIDAAKRHQVPSLLIPHSHFDDDYYHFPDVMESARTADVVLAAPKAASDFLREQGCNAEYLPSPIDTSEQFADSDVATFRAVYADSAPFVLVLGRKAGAKNYKDVIQSVEQFNRDHGVLRVVLIGPDDDQERIESPVATILGRQPREVVRGALLSCLTLANMSSSESFGIVLLEAWLAGKPVVANVRCAAFHDMAVDGWNALLVEKDGLSEALFRLWSDPDLCQRLAGNGRVTASEFDSPAVSARFVQACKDAIARGSRPFPSLIQQMSPNAI